MVDNAVEILKKMIALPSCSFEEERVADFLQQWLEKEASATGKQQNGFRVLRIKNNIAAIPDNYDAARVTLMLNAHIDTVRPAESYTVDPFGAMEKDGTIYGLGSNDDGGCVVSMIQTFLHHTSNSGGHNGSGLENINLVLLLSAEEERSGANGITFAMEMLNGENSDACHLKRQIPEGFRIDFAIVGEPTSLKAAVAERGLLVIDATAYGVSGHAAREEGVNAIYKAMADIETLRNFNFEKVSPIMGKVKLTVTQINAGTVHNVVPDRCTYVIDIRPTEQYTNPEILKLLQDAVESELKARNLKNRSSATPGDHILMKATEALEIEKFVSPTTSDWMKLGIPAIKIGPGDSARSHKADEFIKRSEIEAGIALYINLVRKIDEIAGESCS
ncbi:MAG: M20/M25/M40 family metallo-hydrolase [Bacteroidales bacterium]|nr:M20/M25/M40 family metallo-hydrolase [Bacteroidales bacterium]